MSQFDVYHSNNPKIKKIIPYLVNVQTQVLCDSSTRVVIPLTFASGINKSLSNLYNEFEVEKKRAIMLTDEIIGMPKNVLGSKVVSLLSYRNEIFQLSIFFFWVFNYLIF